jgi:1-acyl-sn-glycerol-3-phosphate acyltransferase
MAKWLFIAIARLITGVSAHWQGAQPSARQRIYFANHSSNLDFLLVWSSLPSELRERTRPVAGQDYWNAGPIRRWLSHKVFNAVLIERKSVTRATNPLVPMLAALEAGDSLIIFPEGTRSADGEIGPFKGGLYHLAKAHPSAELVPVFIQNLNRVLPKGEVLPVPIVCNVTFGEPLPPGCTEPREAFLGLARESLLHLKPD